MMFDFDEQIRGTKSLLRVAGEIDMASAEEFRDHLLNCLERAESVELDLSGVTFIDSSGLAQLVRLRKEAQGAGKTVALVGVSKPTARLLELTGLQGLFGADFPSN